MSSFEKANSNQQPDLSVVFPCYNEAVGIEPLINEWLSLLRQHVPGFEMIVINDGSSDGTGRILDRLRRENRELRVFHQLNGGHGHAVRRGYEAAKGRYVLQVDANGCYEFSDFLRLWQLKEERKLILGRRTHRLDSLLRRSASTLSRKLVNALFKANLNDPGSPFRLIERNALMMALPSIPKGFQGTNLAITVLLARGATHAVTEIPVPYRHRTIGKDKSGSVEMVRSGLCVVCELLCLRMTAPAN